MMEKQLNPSIEKLTNYLKKETDLSGIKVLQDQGMEGVAGYGTTKSLLFQATMNKMPVVVKAGIGNTPAGDEIKNNYEAYQFSKNLGVKLIPFCVSFYTFENYNILIMERGVSSFIVAAKKFERDAVRLQDLYQTFGKELWSTYVKTIKADILQANKFIDYTINRIYKNFNDYLIPNGLAESKVLLKIKEIGGIIAGYTPYKVSWTNWEELLPEHVFLNNANSFFVIDPKGKDKVLGLPQVELAMFGVLCSDVYNLPGGTAYYEMFKNLAVEVTGLAGEGIQKFEVMWRIGKALQYSLSSRFRIGSEPERANLYAKSASKEVYELYDFIKTAGLQR